MLSVVSGLLVLAAASPVRAADTPSGRVLAFVSARPAQQAADPAVAVPIAAFETREGDVLDYLILVPEDRGAKAGVELVFDDGRRQPVRASSVTGAWTRVRAELPPGRNVHKLELVARGGRAGESAFYVDDVRVVRADETSIDLFRDDLPAGRVLVRDLERSAGATLVGAQDELGPVHAGSASGVGDPWAAFDLESLRALESRTADGRAVPDGRVSPDGPALPAGLVWTGPCVPLRFARGGPRVSCAARGQRIALDPLDGGRFYELWFALVNTSDVEVETHVTVHGVGREQFDLPLRVPARGADGFAPRFGEGYPARDFALLDLAVASPSSLAAFELPDDPRLRVLAVTAAWRRDGADDPHFRARWLSRAAATHADMTDADRADLERFHANRRAGAIFGGVEGEDAAERALFDALLVGDLAAMRSQLAQRLDGQAQLGSTRRDARVALLASLPSLDDDLAATLAEGALPADLPVVGGHPRTLEVLARADPAALARLAERARAGTWRTFGAVVDRSLAARLGPEATARHLAMGQRATERLLGGRTGLAWFGGDLGRMRHLPQLLASAGFDTLLLERTPAKIGSPVAYFGSGDAHVWTVAPTVRVEGPLRFEPSLWRTWMAAASGPGRAPIPVLCDVSASAARETFALVEDLEGAELAPRFTWSRLDDVAAAGRSAAQHLLPVAPAPLDPHTARAELDALAAVRSAERALAQFGAVEALAALEGGPAPGRAIDGWWRDLIAAAGRPAGEVATAARAVAERAHDGAGRRLAALRSSAPPAGPGVPLAVLDPLPWSRRTLLEFSDGDLRVAGDNGIDLPAQRTASGGLLVELAGEGFVPRALRVRRDSLNELKSPVRVRLEGWTIRTEALELAIDPSTGRMAHLRALPQNVELLREGSDELAWVHGTVREPIDTLETVEFVERGPLRAVVRRVRTSPRARVVQAITVASGAPWVEVETTVEPLTSDGEVVATVALAHAKGGAVVQIPLGWAAIPVDARALRPLDGWTAATDSVGTVALLGDGGVGFRLLDRAFEVVLAGPGSTEPRASTFGLLGRAGGWRTAGLDSLALERVQQPVLRAFEEGASGSTVREPVVQISRLERDGRRTTGGASGILPLTIEPGGPGTVVVRLVELRGEAARVELMFAREPFDASRVDVLGEPLGAVSLSGRRVELSLGPGRYEAVSVRLAP